MKRKRCLMVLFVLPLLLAACPLSTVHGQQDWPCEQVVVDQAGVLGAQTEQVRAAADALVALGAEVRVFTVDQVAGGDLDYFVDDIQQACSGWHSPADPTVMKGDLIVLGVSLGDRKTGLYYGAAWFEVLDSEHLRIQDELINPRFEGGDFAGGLVAGLEEIGRLVELQRHPPMATAVPVVATAVPAAQGGQSDGGSVGLWAAIVGGLGALAAAGVGGGAWARSRAQRRRAQQRAREVKLKVASRVLELQGGAPFVESEIDNLTQQVTPEYVRTLRDQLAEVLQRARQVASDGESLEIAGSDPEREGLTREEYEGFESSYQELLAVLDQTSQLQEGIHQRIRALQDMLGRLPGALSEAQESIERATAQTQEIGQGFDNRWSHSLIGQAQVRLEQAHQTGRDPERALALLGEIGPLLEEAVRVAGLLPALAARIEEVDGIIDAGAETFEAIAQEYAESSWESVRGNGTEAENRVEWAVEALEYASADLAAEGEENWRVAQERLAQANAWLDEAVGLIESIEAQKKGLEKARQDAPLEVAAASTDIKKAADYIQKHDPDIREQLEGELAAAADELEQAQTALQGALPDFLQVVALAQKANAAADRILSEALSEHEAVERLRRKYLSVSRDADGAVSRAHYYIRDHGRDVGSSAKESLEKARQLSAEGQQKRGLADQQEDLARRQALEQAVGLMEKAGEQAESAYRQAVEDFRQAERARRPNISPVPVPGASPSRPSGWGFPHPAPSWPSSRESSGIGRRRSSRSSSGGGSSGGSGGSSWSSSGGSSRRSSSSRGSSTSWSRSSSSSHRSGGSSSWSRSSSSSSKRGGGSTGW